MILLQQNIPANAPFVGEEPLHWVIQVMLVAAVVVIPIVLFAFWKLAKNLDKSNIAEDQWED